MSKERGRPRNENLIKLNDVPKLLLELSGVTRGRATIYLWVRHGRANNVGETVKLHATKRLGTWYTTRQWVEDFIKAIG